jgi:transcriptional regulator with XRE-family HTH domain
MTTKKKAKPLDPEDQRVKLGQRIKQLRKKMGFTSAEAFAYEHKFQRATYGKYEQGRNLEYFTLVRLCNSFGITLKEFFSEGFE